MPRLPRSQLDDGFFHATARANFGVALFVDDLDRLDSFSSCARPSTFSIGAATRTA
jgi:hypothetical protein